MDTYTPYEHLTLHINIMTLYISYINAHLWDYISVCFFESEIFYMFYCMCFRGSAILCFLISVHAFIIY